MRVHARPVIFRSTVVLKTVTLLVCLLASTLTYAEVVSVKVASRRLWAGGQVFGNVGAYEMLRGTVHYAIDPRSPSAGNVTDIRYAPVNAKGLVNILALLCPLLVPAVDHDGNELGGWRDAMSSVPLGTYTAWDWKSPELAPFGFISGLNDAFIPFARTRAERVAANAFKETGVLSSRYNHLRAVLKEPSKS